MFKQLAFIANPVNIFSELKGLSTWGRYFAPITCALIIYLCTNVWGSAWWEILSAVSGVLCVVLVADRKLTNFFWGLINCSLYGLTSYNGAFYGDMGLNWFLYVPFQFIGLWMWTRQGASDGEELISNRITGAWRYKVAVIVVGVTLVLEKLLASIGGAHPLADASNVVLSITATILMAYRYREQWICWIGVNVTGIIMWSLKFNAGESEGIAPLLMWCAFLVNSVYGYWTWSNASKTVSEGHAHV